MPEELDGGLRDLPAQVEVHRHVARIWHQDQLTVVARGGVNPLRMLRRHEPVAGAVQEQDRRPRVLDGGHGVGVVWVEAPAPAGFVDRLLERLVGDRAANAGQDGAG